MLNIGTEVDYLGGVPDGIAHLRNREISFQESVSRQKMTKQSGLRWSFFFWNRLLVATPFWP